MYTICTISHRIYSRSFYALFLWIHNSLWQVHMKHRDELYIEPAKYNLGMCFMESCTLHVCGVVGHMLVKGTILHFVCVYLCKSSVLLYTLQSHGRGWEDFCPDSYHTVPTHCRQQRCQLRCGNSWFLRCIRQKVDTYLHKEQCGPSWHSGCQLDRHHISAGSEAGPSHHIRCQCPLGFRQ